MFRKFILPSVFLLIWVSCQNMFDESSKQKKQPSITDTLPKTAKTIEVVSTLDLLFNNFPPPIALVNYIKESNVPYSTRYISPMETEKFNTNIKKALGLGFLAANIGYLSIYNKTEMKGQYVKSMQSLATDLQVDKFYDFDTISHFAGDYENMKQLASRFMSSLKKMDNNLQENDSLDISTMIICGFWIESLYLTTQIVKKSSDWRITENIGEQKKVLNYLLIIFEHHQANPEIAEIYAMLQDLKNEYKEVHISYEYGDSKVISKAGKKIIKKEKKKTINITNEQLTQIAKKVADLRKKIINL